MLQMYLASIFIWIVILNCVALICASKIINNGWLENYQAFNNKGFMYIFMIACIPVMRLFVAIAIIVMASMTPEEYEALNSDKDKFEK